MVTDCILQGEDFYRISELFVILQMKNSHFGYQNHRIENLRSPA